MEDGDSDGDIHSDGGIDRTGHNELYGPRAILDGRWLMEGLIF